MLAIQDTVALIERVGIRAVRAKSVALTSFAVEAMDEVLSGYGVVLASPRDPDIRGSHITIDHPAFKDITARLWQRGIIPDYRNPDGIRLGLSPLSTSFAETWTGIEAIAGELQHHS